MRRALAIVAVLGLAGGAFVRSARADDRPPEARASIRVEDGRRPCYVGESIALTMSIEYEEEDFRAHAVTTFLRPMDVPLKVEAPWWDALPGTESVGGPGRVRPLGPARPTFALNDVVTEADLVGETNAFAEGPRRRSLSLLRTIVARAPGDIVVPAATLRFAWAKEFREDAFGGRVPIDPRDVVLASKPLTLHIVALPTAGRPPEFDGAVGRFTIEAAADRHDVEVGRPFRLTLRIVADGPAAIAPPRLDGIEGFHVFGAIDDHGPEIRTVVFDVAATDPAVTEFPPIAFAFFEPRTPAGYRVVRTAAIPLVVRPARGADAGPAGAPPRGGEPMPGLVQESAFLWISGALVVLVILAFTLRAKRRARARAAIDPALVRARAAGEAFRARISRADADPAEALAEFLAARLATTAASVIGPDLAPRLVAAGADAELAARAAEALERLVAARYARRTAGGDPAGLVGLVAALERSLPTPKA